MIKIVKMGRFWQFLLFLAILSCCSCVDHGMRSEKLCGQCNKCESSTCPRSEAYPHIKAFDNTLIAAALQSDFVMNANDRSVYSVPDVKGGSSPKFNAYFGWQSSPGSATAYRWLSNYMDKCSEERSYLTADKHGNVTMKSLKSVESVEEADWEIIHPISVPDRDFCLWVSHITGKCLTVLPEKINHRRAVTVSDCYFDGSNSSQLFAFDFNYHKAFCCCDVHN